MANIEDQAELSGVLANAIDLHVHAGPSFFDRKYDSIELAQECRDIGLGGIVLKSHFGNTNAQVTMARKRNPGVGLFSSVTLNSFIGGFNPVAVEYAIASGARIVWMPTFSAANFCPEGIGRDFTFSRTELRAITEDGSLKDAVIDVLRTLDDSERRVTLGNGHLSLEETEAILDSIESMGLDIPFLVTHADFSFMGIPPEKQVELAERGAFLEKCYLPVVYGDITIDQMVDTIRKIGIEQCVLSTDHGQANNTSPPEAYLEFLTSLRNQGITETELEEMAVSTARRILDPHNSTE